MQLQGMVQDCGCPPVVHYLADLQLVHGCLAMTTQRRT